MKERKVRKENHKGKKVNNARKKATRDEFLLVEFANCARLCRAVQCSAVTPLLHFSAGMCRVGAVLDGADAVLVHGLVHARMCACTDARTYTHKRTHMHTRHRVGGVLWCGVLVLCALLCSSGALIHRELHARMCSRLCCAVQPDRVACSGVTRTRCVVQ
jgi:hypothetical protein